MYYVLNISAGLATPGADFVVRLVRFARMQFVLFNQSSTKSKPVWTPTDTYYQRLKLRLMGTNKPKSPLENLPTATSTPETFERGFNSRSVLRQPDETAVSYDSLEMEPEGQDIHHFQFQSAEKSAALIPVPQYQLPAVPPVGGQIGGGSAKRMDDGQITREITFSVTTEPAKVH
ncbi:hypothetical protein N0V82_005189 [Gnomoniopsis sp. IMI 355080]|nr:hypothetical protein N0V82_005189 [Gnomoniopsis sp. IMI 355080]